VQTFKADRKGEKMEKSLTFKMVPLVALFFAFCVVACSSEKSIDTSGGKISVKESEDGIEVKSKDGSLTIKGNESTGHIKIKTDEGEDIEVSYNKANLVQGFPKDAPIYSPSRVTMSQVLQSKNAVATFSTKDATDKVALFYKKALPDKGWSDEGQMNMGDMVILQGKKGNKILNVSVVKGDAETNITMAITEEEGGK